MKAEEYITTALIYWGNMAVVPYTNVSNDHLKQHSYMLLDEVAHMNNNAIILTIIKNLRKNAKFPAKSYPQLLPPKIIGR